MIFRLGTALCLLVSASFAERVTFNVDRAHSAANFSVKHMMVSTVRGTAGPMSGTVEFDPADPTSAKINVSVDIKGINTNEPKRDAHLKSADFFDVEKFPTMTFVSKKVAAAGTGKWKLTGDLTIHGVTKEVTFDVDGPATPIKQPNGAMKTGASATTTINRKDFGVNWSRTMDSGGLVVADEVTITIDLELNAPAPQKSGV